jgi:hypothetical protein
VRETKYCPVCEKDLPVCEFYEAKNTKTGLERRCKDCKMKAGLAARNKRFGDNPKLGYDYHRRADLKKKYGLTIEDYEQMFESQNSLCAICGLPEWTMANSGTRVRRLAVDHEEKDGKVFIRGLLCAQCNVGIGNLKHDITLLNKAIDYLIRTTNGR